MYTHTFVCVCVYNVALKKFRFLGCLSAASTQLCRQSSLEASDGNSGSAHLLTASYRSIKRQHPVTPCRKLSHFSMMGDIKCTLLRPGVAFAKIVIMIDVSIIILKAKRVRNFPAAVLGCCWAGGV